MAISYVPPDVIVNHMIASGSIEAKEVHVLKRSCTSFRDALAMNQQVIVDACFTDKAMSENILRSQFNIPRAAALHKAVLHGNIADVGTRVSDPALFFGGPPKTFEQFDKTFTVLNHLTTLAETRVYAGMAKWTLARWILYASLAYLLGVVTNEGAIQAVAGNDRKAFMEHVGEYCSKSIQYSMNPFDPKDDDEGNVRELVGLAYEVWLRVGTP